jgi:hypothetical protein
LLLLLLFFFFFCLPASHRTSLMYMPALQRAALLSDTCFPTTHPTNQPLHAKDSFSASVQITDDVAAPGYAGLYNNRWRGGGIISVDGGTRVLGVPLDAEHVLSFRHSVSEGGVRSDASTVGVVAQAVPNNISAASRGDGEALLLPSSVTAIGELQSELTSGKWFDGLIVGNRFLIGNPWNADVVLVYDSATNRASASGSISAIARGANVQRKHVGSVLAGDAIYFLPAAANGVLRFGPNRSGTVGATATAAPSKTTAAMSPSPNTTAVTLSNVDEGAVGNSGSGTISRTTPFVLGCAASMFWF